MLTSSKVSKTLVASIFLSFLTFTNVPASQAAESNYSCVDGTLIESGSPENYYVVNDSGILTTGGFCTGDVVIGPEVLEIGVEAFAENANLAKVIIGESVTAIRQGAFINSRVNEIVIPGGVETIDDYAFENAPLETLTISSGVKNIGVRAFTATSIKELVIPDSVLTIGSGAFRQSAFLQRVIIGNGVTSIADYAFAYNSTLETVTIGSSVTEIGAQAFQETSLKQVAIPDSVTTIGIAAFFQIATLETVTIGNQVTSIGTIAFANCALKRIVIPNSVLNIGMAAFTGNTALASVTLGNQVNSIGESAFQGLAITEILIPGSVDVIGDYAFDSNPSLVSVIIENGNSTIGAEAFAHNTALVNVTIGEGVTSIGRQAFFGDISLRKVIIPGSVSTIGYEAFYENQSLAELVIGQGVTEIGAGAFAGSSSLKYVSIPSSVTDLGDYAFQGTSLNSVAFEDITNLSINYGADGFRDFFGGTPISTVYHSGTSASVTAYFDSKSEWTVVYIDSPAGWTVPANAYISSELSSTATSRRTLTTQPSITIKDRLERTATAFTGDVVASLTGPGYLTGETKTAAVAGVATFNNLAISGAGNFTINFTAGDLTPVISKNITVAIAPQTRDLPSGVEAYAISYQGGYLLKVDVKTGVGVKVGDQEEDASIYADVTGAAYVPTLRAVYYVNNDSLDAERDTNNQLRKISIVTGIDELVETLTVTDNPSAQILFPVIAAGPDETLWVFYRDEERRPYVGQVDPISAKISEVTQLDIAEGDSFPNSENYFGFNYSSFHKKWFLVPSGLPNTIWEINLTLGDITQRKVSGTSADGFYGVTFDSQGTIWGMNDAITSQTFEEFEAPGDFQKSPLVNSTGQRLWDSGVYSYALFLVQGTPTTPVKSAEQLAAEAQAARQAAINVSRNDVINTVSQPAPVTVAQLQSSDLPAINESDLGEINAEIVTIPQEEKKDFAAIAAVVLKFATVNKIATGARFTFADLVSVKLVASNSTQKSIILKTLRSLPASQKDTFQEIKSVIAAIEKKAADRKARAAALKSRSQQR